MIDNILDLLQVFPGGFNRRSKNPVLMISNPVGEQDVVLADVKLGRNGAVHLSEITVSRPSSSFVGERQSNRLVLAERFEVGRILQDPFHLVGDVVGGPSAEHLRLRSDPALEDGFGAISSRRDVLSRTESSSASATLGSGSFRLSSRLTLGGFLVR